MAILQIKSNNPDFSYLIRKNPESPMLVKKLRKGHLFGWYTSPDTYNCFFKDAPNEVSYKEHPDDQFEYINTTRYNSAMFVLNTLSSFFQTNLKSITEKDGVDKFENEIVLEMIQVKSAHYLRIFNDYFDDFNLEYEEIAPKNYKIKLSTKKTLNELLNFTNLFVVFNALRNKDHLVVDDQLTEKFLESLQVIDAPYFIRYIFKINFLDNSKKFKKFLHIIQNSKKEKIEFVKGNTLEMRMREIKNLFTMSRPIIDVGCGEGNYVTGYGYFKKYTPGLAQDLKDLIYYAIDRDEECREIVKKRIERKELKNVKILSSFEEFLDISSSLDYKKGYEILLTEVIEHSPLKESTSLVKQLLSFEKTERLIITTPNKDFNKFFIFEEGQKFRHEDHDFEFTEKEFTDWIKKIVSDKFNVEVFGIGDRVEGMPVTLCAKIFRK